MTIKATTAPALTRTAMGLLGPVFLSVHYSGDCWEVVTESEDERGIETSSSEFFSSLAAARAYMENY